MPIFELGYRHWEGRRTASWLRWWPIARTGVALAFRSKVLRRLVFLAWAPLLYFGPLFFAVGYVTNPAHAGLSHGLWGAMAREFLGPEVANQFAHDPESLRPLVWSAVFSHFFIYSQSFLTFLVLAIVAPPLIAQDVRSKAFLLYFSKPITRGEYLLGKGGTALLYVFLVTLFPGLVLYAVSIAFSPSLGAIADTGLTVPRIFAASAVVGIPAVLVALVFSSLTGDTRYAAFGWIAMWLLGELFFRILHSLPGLSHAGWVFVPSLRETASVVIGAIFDSGQVAQVANQLNFGASDLGARLHSPYSPAAAAAWLAAVCVISLAVLYRRISAPMRV